MRTAPPFYLLLTGLLTAGCHSPGPPAAIREAVAAYLRQHGAALGPRAPMAAGRC